MTGRAQRCLVEGIFVFVYAALVAIVVQHIVGDMTIYASEVNPSRLRAHAAILDNTPPTPAGWSAAGMNGMNIRVGTVYAAETVADVTGFDVLKVYKLIDMAALVGAIGLLYLFLRHWFPPPWALFGLALLTAALPLTLLDHYFHPHDRPTLLLWIAILMAIRADRPLVLAALLAIAVPTKYDAVVAPGLYFLATVDRTNWLRQGMITAGLCVLAFGLYVLLLWALPGGSEPGDIGTTLQRNVWRLLKLSQPHPVVLGLAPLFLLGVAGWRDGDRFMRTAFVFGLLLLPIFFTLVHFHELRAMMMVFVMMLPLAVAGAARLLATPPAQRGIGSSAWREPT